ncbi:MAG: hypothetical protein LBF38_12840 [Deltaproteobacteria bacterium]|jgi:hypothetical protein|nr:hypothetical protein [Deltaproteobacteria bacterium]
MAHSEEKWREAKRICRLNKDDIALAKRLGLSPRSLTKNIPNKNQLWKAPIKQWLRDIEESRQIKSEQKKRRREKAAKLKAAQSPAPNNETGQAAQSPAPNNQTGAAAQSLAPNNETGAAAQTASANDETDKNPTN